MPAPNHNEQQFLDAYHAAIENGETMLELSRRLDTHISNVYRRRDRLIEAGHILPILVGRVGERFDQADLATPNWTREECIQQLRNVQAANPQRWITGRWLCNELRVRDTVFTKHFGTIEEFFRQAGIGKLRQLSQLGKETAKHVSVDHRRAHNARGEEWGEAYLRDNGARFKTILGANDIHDKDCDPFWRRVFLDTAKRAQPDVIVLNGDVYDLPEFGKYTVDPRTFDVVGRMQWVHQFLAELREACPDAQIDLIEGNHEFRLVRHMADASPAMMSLLSDLHGMKVADLFGLPKFEVNYVAKADLAAYRVCDIKAEVARNWRIYYDCVLANHFPDAARMGLPGWNGHHHSHKVTQYSSPKYGPYEWHQVGSGHRRDATYCNGEAWGNGFILWHVDSVRKHSNAEYVPVTDFACVGGRYYHRSLDECWHSEQAIGRAA